MKKKFRLERDSNPCRVFSDRCSALPTELSSRLGAGQPLWVHKKSFFKFLSFWARFNFVTIRSQGLDLKECIYIAQGSRLYSCKTHEETSPYNLSPEEFTRRDSGRRDQSWSLWPDFQEAKMTSSHDGTCPRDLFDFKERLYSSACEILKTKLLVFPLTLTSTSWTGLFPHA